MVYTLSLLTGRVHLWGTVEWNWRLSCRSTSKKFGDELTKGFDPAQPEADVSYSLLTLPQVSRPVINYIISFRTASVDNAWKEVALLGTFYRDLSDQLKLAPAS